MAAAGEHEEHSELYPHFAEVAEKEGFKVIAGVFRLISKVEIEHEKRYLKLLENVETDHVFKKDGTNRWKCILCGYVHEGPEAPAKCPVCLNPKAFFEIKETNY
ncbi:rubrerythrin family protein, partial [uncultured Fusobacterium sp.]